MSRKSGKICLFLSNWVGDVVMSTPAVRRLHDRLGEASTFTAVGRPHLLQLLEGNPWINETIPFDGRSGRSKNTQGDVVRRLREEKFDALILFPNSFRSAMVAWRGGARRRIGYDVQCRSLLLTHGVRPSKTEIPLVDYYLNLVESAATVIDGTAMPIPGDSQQYRRLELHATPEEEKLGDDVWNNLGLRSPENVIVLNVGSVNSPMRHWPMDHAAELARTITDRLDMDVLLNCGPGETETVREIVEKSRSLRVFSMADQPLNIHTGKICIKRARLTVSTDSGPLHIALGFGNPAIVLRGPTGDVYTANPSADLTVISRHWDCSPCHAKKQCPEKHHRCMSEITPEIVFTNIVEVLERR